MMNYKIFIIIFLLILIVITVIISYTILNTSENFLGPNKDKDKENFDSNEDEDEDIKKFKKNNDLDSILGLFDKIIKTFENINKKIKNFKID